MSLFQVKIEIPAVEADAVDEALLEVGVEGWSLLEDAIAHRAWIVGIFVNEAETCARWSELRSILGSSAIAPMLSPEFSLLGDDQWRDSYKAHFKAWQFGRLHWVPIWERDVFELPRGHAVLWLDPGLAFGTGNHETTRLCIERLVTLASGSGTQRRVIDAGCGSGILALSAALLGYRDVLAFDNDPDAVRVSQENATVNSLCGQVTFFVGDLAAGLSNREADIILANIQADVLTRFASDLLAAVAPKGVLVLSGILAVENYAVRQSFAAKAPGWAMDFRIMDEWSDVVLIRA